jgi:dethiobiotin synthetase
MHYFITGTDTNVGKTYVTCLFLEALQRAGKSAVGYKPISCGDRSDADALMHASSGSSLLLADINPIHLKTPLSPYVAAMVENRRIDLDVLRSAFFDLALHHDSVLIEGAGGWEVPLSPGMTMADLAESLGLPVIVVVDNRLGALNHTIMTVRNVQSRGLECAGIVLNHTRDERDAASISNRQVLEQFLGLPILADVMFGETEIDWVL